MFVMVMCLGDVGEMTAATAAKAAAGSGLSAVGCSRSAAAMMMLTNGGVQYGFPPVYWEEPSCGQCVRRGGGGGGGSKPPLFFTPLLSPRDGVCAVRGRGRGGGGGGSSTLTLFPPPLEFPRTGI